jgi:PAS domain S-box-containing protein
MKGGEKTKEQLLVELEAAETGRKQVEEALQESEERYHRLVELSPDATMVYSKGKIVFINTAGARLLGAVDHEPLVGKPLMNFVHPDYRETVKKRLRGMRKRGKTAPFIEERFVQFDGTEIDVEIAGVPLTYQGKPAVQIIMRDISERMWAEEALRESEERFRTVADFTYGWEYWMAPAGNYLYVSPSCERITGYRAYEFIKDPALLQKIVHPDNYALVARHLEEGLEIQEALSIDFRIITHSGEERWIEHVCQPVYDADGRYLGRRASNRNITERKRAEEALRQYATALEARNEELDAFAHTVAHDLKSLLTLSVGYAETLEENYAAMEHGILQEYLHTIAENGRKMNNVIDELLLLAGVRKKEVGLVYLDMASIVAEAQRRLVDLVEKYQAEIVLPEHWAKALGYGPWIEEVWVNYLSNAIKHGGRPPRAELGATVQPGGSVCFWIRDNGPGLTPEEQARLFTPFTRLDQARAKGHGLGLSIVRRIVEKLGGQVGVESKVGQGSVFTFTLSGV